MARTATDQSTVLDAVAERIIREVSDKFTHHNCYQTIEPNPDFEHAHHLFCHVSPGDGRYNDGAMAGGGSHTCFEHTGTYVTIFNRVRLDPVNHAEQILKESSRGLLILKHRILKALTDHDLQDKAGNEIVINLIAPITATQPQLYRDKGVASLSILFSTDFEWNLQ